jgi:hypothetical protein
MVSAIGYKTKVFPQSELSGKQLILEIIEIEEFLVKPLEMANMEK